MSTTQLEMGRGYTMPSPDVPQHGKGLPKRESPSGRAVEGGFGPSSVIELSSAARQMLAKTDTQTAPTTQNMSSPGGNPDGTVTTVEEVVIVGERRTLFTVSFPPAIPWNPGGLADELPNLPPEPIPLTPCQKETAIDRAAMEAGAIIDGLPGSNNKEWGMYLVRDHDGSIRGVGPIEGHNANGQNYITWDASLQELGIDSWSQLVGLIHNHPSTGNEGLAREFSEADADVTAAFVNGGASPDFRQYIKANGEVYQFDKDADAEDVSNDVVDGSGCDDS